MANIKTKIDEWEVTDLEDNGVLRVYVEHNTEMGNRGVPGIQVWYTVAGGTSIVNYEPVHVERWAYQAQKAGETDYLLTDYSWINHEDTYVKNSLILGEPLKAKVSVKVRSKKEPIIKEYALPFAVE
jgi:3-deoxy-D-arabino-heptulosonate 7-phosphate (DAHP) synthase